MHRLGALFVLLMFSAAVGPGATVETPADRSSVLLNGIWEFAEGDQAKLPADGWRRVRVPHRTREFEPDPPEQGWYRSTITVPDHWRTDEADIVLDLSRVRHYAQIYVADKLVGEHYGMRTPFEINLTNVVTPGQSHPIAIYTHSSNGHFAVPGDVELGEHAARAVDALFWHTSAATIGIEGNVWLRLVPPVRIDDVYIITSVRKKKVTFEVTLANDTQTEQQVRLTMRVIRDGQRELDPQDHDIVVAPRSATVVLMESPWNDPILWGHAPFGEPVLYFAQAALHRDEDGKLLDTSVTRFGFREIWAEGDRLLLNRQQIFNWGDHSVPYVYDRQFLTRMLPDLVDGNINIAENHRYDAPPVLYDVADELGMFVVSSNFCAGTGQTDDRFTEDEWPIVIDHHVEVAKAWIKRDRNHPSILFWDVTDTSNPRYCEPLLRAVKSVDKTRIVEVTHRDPTPAIIELADTYRLFSSFESIQETVKELRSGAYPVKPIRVGETRLFDNAMWPLDQPPPIHPRWIEFMMSMRKKNIHGLQTFNLTDMDYRGLDIQIPSMLATPIDPKISWPSQSGTDARIDPMGEGTKWARAKAAMYLNWCDPDLPVSIPTETRNWSRQLFRNMAGRDVGKLSSTRVPEVIITVKRRGGAPVGNAIVFAEPLEGQAVLPFGIRADEQGTSWFVMPEPGRYRFTCRDNGHIASVDMNTTRKPIDVKPGYTHIDWADIYLSD